MEKLNCPYCGSKIKQKSKKRDQYPHDTYMTPTIYECGTVTSENWNPPIQDKNCIAIQKSSNK